MFVKVFLTYLLCNHSSRRFSVTDGPKGTLFTVLKLVLVFMLYSKVLCMLKECLSKQVKSCLDLHQFRLVISPFCL